MRPSPTPQPGDRARARAPRLMRVLLLAAVLVVMPAPLGATGRLSALPLVDTDGTSGTADLDQQIQILDVEANVDEVVLDVAVPPSLGELAPISSNFGVTDGGQLVDVAVSPLGPMGDTVLAIDTSGSMQGSALTAAVAAASSFAETLPAGTSAGLVSFGDTVKIHREPSTDLTALEAQLAGLTTAGGETALWDALVTAADLVARSEGAGSSVVVLSDGDDTVSSATRRDAIEHLNASSAVLYAVVIDSPDIDPAALQEAVDLTGGQVLTTSGIAELEPLYTDIAGRLANRYELRFTPAREGARNVVVSVAAGDRVATAQVALTGPPGSPASGRGSGAGAGVSGGSPVSDASDTPAGRPATVVAANLWADPRLLWVGTGSVFAALTLAALLVKRPPAHVKLATATASGADRVAGIKARLGRVAEGFVARHDRTHRLDARLDAADISLRPGELVVVWLLSTALAGLGAWALAGPVLGVLAIPTSAAATHIVLGFRASRRRSRFADQLTETMGLLASSLRAGRSLPQSIELVATEAPSPTAEEFHRIHFETRVGRDLTASLLDVARRMESRDLEWLAQAVDIHRELGGDLTEILQSVAATVRERRTVARQVDALSAEGRATGWVLLGMPIVLFLFSWWRTPASIERMVTEPTGRVLLAVAAMGMVIGRVWIRHLVKVRY